MPPEISMTQLASYSPWTPLLSPPLFLLLRLLEPTLPTHSFTSLPVPPWEAKPLPFSLFSPLLPFPSSTFPFSPLRPIFPFPARSLSLIQLGVLRSVGSSPGRSPDHHLISVSLWAHETRLVIAILGHSRLQKWNFKYDGLLNISLYSQKMMLQRNVTSGKSRDWRLIYKWQVQVTNLCASGFYARQHTGWAKKVSQRGLHITSSNTGKFSKFFHCHILQEICTEAIARYSTSPQTCRYLTLWNTNVRKVVNQRNLSHYSLHKIDLKVTNLCASGFYARQHTGWAKKVSQRGLHITSSKNTGKFSKFFHCHILQEICTKAIARYSTSPQTCRYLTLWNTNVRKVVNQRNLSHYSLHKIEI